MARPGELEMSFNTMPTSLQLEILGFIQSRDLKSARLVSKKWFAMISYTHPPGFKLLENNMELLEILKRSYHRTIGKLEIGQFTLDLPISSSYRCQIPRTHHLALSKGNSTENIVKLLRYYAKNCKTLILNDKCFGKFPPGLLNGTLSYKFLNSLEIMFDIPFNFGPGAWYFQKHNHLTVLRKFLEYAKLPSLNKLNINSGYVVTERVALQTFHRFNEALDLFLEIHGQQLIDFTYFGISLRFVKSFKYLRNVENLKFSFLKHLAEEDLQNDTTTEALKHVKRLKSLEFKDLMGMSEFYYQTISILLNENRKSLKTFRLMAFQARADWLPLNTTLELTEMRLSFLGFNEANLLNLATIIPRKLESVKNLFVIMLSDGLENNNNGNSEDQVIPWLIATFPNLDDLTLCTQVRITELIQRMLIRGLSKMTSMMNIFFNPEPDVDDGNGQVPTWVAHEPDEEGVIVMSLEENMSTSWNILRPLN